jgi:hypothetical protein
LTRTSFNHAKIIALYKASRECLWLRRVIDYINDQCGLPKLTEPIVLFKDNYACVEQISKDYIKSDRIKHIAKFFFIHEQQEDTIQVKAIARKDNHENLFTKPLPPTVHQFHCEGIGLRKLSKLIAQSELLRVVVLFSSQECERVLIRQHL